MIALEKVFEGEAPDLVVVVGDVNSTLAASVTAASWGSTSPMSRQGCGALIAPCRKRSTALSQIP